MTPQIHDTPWAPDQVAQVPGWQVDIQLGVPWVLHTATIGVAGTLDQPNREFTEADRTNGTLQAFVEQSPVWTIVKLGWHECEVIQSWSEKLLILSEIITKDRDGMRDISQWEWIETIISTQWVSGLKVMSQDQMGPIQNDERIFPHWMIYLSSSPYSGGFWAWGPAFSSWGHCFAGSTYCYNSDYPMALRCVVELS